MKKKIAHTDEFTEGAEYDGGPVTEAVIVALIIIGFAFYEMWKYCS